MELIQRGEQKPWLWVVCDLILALCVGWIVLGIGVWLGLGYMTTHSLAILAGRAGPQLIDRVLAKAINKYLGKPGDNSEG